MNHTVEDSFPKDSSATPRRVDTPSSMITEKHLQRFKDLHHQRFNTTISNRRAYESLRLLVELLPILAPYVDASGTVSENEKPRPCVK